MTVKTVPSPAPVGQPPSPQAFSLLGCVDTRRPVYRLKHHPWSED